MTAAMREYMRVPAGWVVPLPKGLSLFDAMALGTAGYTAGLAVVRMEHEGLKPGNGPVIVTGATGGVGSIAIDILAGAGYHVVALTGKESADRLPQESRRQRGHAAKLARPLQDQAARQGHLGRRGGQPRRRGAGLARQHHARSAARSRASGWRRATRSTPR